LQGLKQACACTPDPKFFLKFDPIDWQQLELLAKLAPGERMRASVMAHEFATAVLRGTLQRRFPDLSLAELNMMGSKALHIGSGGGGRCFWVKG
jgi:hypothetical protein